MVGQKVDNILVLQVSLHIAGIIFRHLKLLLFVLLKISNPDLDECHLPRRLRVGNRDWMTNVLD